MYTYIDNTPLVTFLDTKSAALSRPAQKQQLLLGALLVVAVYAALVTYHWQKAERKIY